MGDAFQQRGRGEARVELKGRSILRGGLAVGVPSFDAVVAEHVPEMPGGEWCRSCGFVYTDLNVCPAVILAEAGFADLADRVRVVPEADREYGALCELTMAVQRMGARLDVIGASVAAVAPGKKARRHARWPRGVGAMLGARRPAVSR